MEFDYNDLPIKIFNIIRNFIVKSKNIFGIERNHIEPYPLNIKTINKDYSGNKINWINKDRKFNYDMEFISINFMILPKNQKKYIKMKDKNTGIEYDFKNKFYIYENFKEPIIIDGIHKPKTKSISINIYIQQDIDKEKAISFLDKHKDFHINYIRSLIIHETTHLKDREISLKILSNNKNYFNKNKSWLEEYRSPLETNAIITSLIYTYKSMKNKENVTLLDLIKKSGMYDILNALINSPKWTERYLKRLNREGIPIRESGFRKINNINELY
jgi:hypothetical protein